MATDIQKLIAEVAARHHVTVDPDDPIFAVSTINQLMLEEVGERLVARFRVLLTASEASMRAVEAEAGKSLGERVRSAATETIEQFRNTAAEVNAEKAKHTNRAETRACELIEKVNQAHSKPARLLFGTIGLLAALILVACGILIGRIAR